MDSLRCRTKLAWYGRQAKVHSHLNSAINLRKSKKPAPKLNESQILSITVDGEVFQGIKLDVVFMWSFWSRIGSIGEIIPIDKEVRRSTYSAQSSNSFQESSYWFKMDLNRGIEREDSWYQRLARAVVETALPLLDIHVAEEGRTKRSIYNDDITESHLLATWTQGGLDSPAIGANGRFRAPQHFPIHDLSLEDWKNEISVDIMGHHIENSDSVEGFESFSELNSQLTHPKIFNPWPEGIPETIQHIAREEEDAMRERIACEIGSGIPQVGSFQSPSSDSSMF